MAKTKKSDEPALPRIFVVRKHRVVLTSAKGSYLLPLEVRFERYLRAELRAPGEKGREEVRALCAPVYR